MNNVFNTLFLPLDQGLISFDRENSAIAVLNAQNHPSLQQLGSANLLFEQAFKPYADPLENAGYNVSPEINIPENTQDLILIAAPKNVTESQSLIAKALQSLREGGTLIIAADNKAGGSRLSKLLAEFGLSDIQTLSKHKARAAWAKKTNIRDDVIQTALNNGAMQKSQTGFFAQPGMFGWDKIDAGSTLLTEQLPTTLNGAGADFGCGYGFLAHHALSASPGIKRLTCIDADHRAIGACQKNLENFTDRTEFQWKDLTAPTAAPTNLDWIIMNPPFHEGKTTSPDIGKAFIQNAHKSLRPGGELWMVANAHLPYEKILGEIFKTTEKKFEGQGFKIFCATK